MLIVFQTRSALVVTVKGFIHHDVNLALDGNVCNDDVTFPWLRLAGGVVGTIDEKISSVFQITTFS